MNRRVWDRAAIGPERRGAARAAPLFALFCAFLCLALLAPEAFAQSARHPFAVGGAEGAASAQGISGWILAKEAGFYRLLSASIRAAKESGMAAWGLAALSFAYGIFHAAGPGHGKAVIASYMLANERALRRGMGIAFGAAFLQGLSAIAIVGASALIFKATAKHMTAAANAVEIASYSAIAALGVYLVSVKGAALVRAWRKAPSFAAAAAGQSGAVFAASSCAEGHDHGPGCGHAHAPDPRALGAEFSWKSALLTIAAAGLRPCSGAILVLVFALAQGIFPAGVLAVAAMSAGTAVTTAALASAAVLAKSVAVKYSKASSRQALLAGRLFEAAAAFAVLALGLILLFAALSRGGGTN